ncbi:hypothetical protein C8Q77DRAFT_1070275 [Trametes polyzona]|nr:hypothetical protein C8Q77DRAFT_1070275 [Trametes polyzona]
MESLPVEIVRHIFELACTDGGQTGHSISLASKAFREIGRTSRFHSILLAASPRRLLSFIALYQGECVPTRGDKPRVRHLHVTFPRIFREDASRGEWDDGRPMLISIARRRSLSPQPNRWQSKESPTSSRSTTPSDLDSGPEQPQILTPGMVLSCGTPEADKDPTTSPEYLHAARTLFHLVAPDLVTLVVQCGFQCGGPLHLPAIGGPFSQLREATFVGIDDPSSLLGEGSMAAQTPLFPVLTHLSLMPAWGAYRGLHIPFWSANAPRVTHLRVSCAESFTNDVAAAVGVRVKAEWHLWFLPEPERDGAEAGASQSLAEPPPVPTYPSVRYVVLQPGPGPIGAWCGNAWMDHDMHVEVLREVARRAARVGIEALMVEAPKTGKFDVYYQRAMREWLERLEGDGRDAGCWGEVVGHAQGPGAASA